MSGRSDHEGRIVGWLKYDGDEYHGFLYQTHDPRPSEVDRMKRAGWLAVIIAAPDDADRETDRHTPVTSGCGLRFSTDRNQPTREYVCQLHHPNFPDWHISEAGPGIRVRTPDDVPRESDGQSRLSYVDGYHDGWNGRTPREGPDQLAKYDHTAESRRVAYRVADAVKRFVHNWQRDPTELDTADLFGPVYDALTTDGPERERVQD